MTEPKALSKEVKTYLLTPEERLEIHKRAIADKRSESYTVAELIRKGLTTCVPIP